MKSLFGTLSLSMKSLFSRMQTGCKKVTLHYRRRHSDYDGWKLHIWGETSKSSTWEDSLPPDGRDAYGIYWQIPMQKDADTLHYIIHNGNEKDPGPDQIFKLSEEIREIWLTQGRNTQFTDPGKAIDAMIITLESAPSPAANQVLLHYRRNAEDYDGWGLHVWGDVLKDGNWITPLQPIGQDEYGVYWLIDIQTDAKNLHYVVHKGDIKDPGPNQTLDVTAFGQEVYIIEGSSQQFSDSETAKNGLSIAGIGDLKNRARAHWLKRDLIAWPTGYGPQETYRLYHNPLGDIQITKDGMIGGKEIQLTWIAEEIPQELALVYPHLRNACLLKIPDQYLDLVPEILKGQHVVTVHQDDGQIMSATSLQIAGVLDDLYAHNAKQAQLGISWENDIPTIRVWAPTARSVNLQIFTDSNLASEGKNLSMSFDAASGIWQISGQSDWKEQYYLYDVEVFVRQEGKLVHNIVSDPYAISLTTNATRCQIIDLDDPELKPDGWDEISKPPLEAPTDIVIYELHLRDFSATDESVLPEHRGTYLAFTHFESNGMKHLQALAQAGLTHLHLLPVFDVATINEDKSTWKQVDFEALSQFPPDSDQQQAAVQAICDKDAYNWGYDPHHYTTPEGAYASQPDGAARTKEFRQMVAALNKIGLRVIMDVVYNHTHSSGQNEKSVLDRVVPGYYHRLDGDGYTCNSTCCSNTATEHAMMEKLMLDSLHTWAVQYKIDGFRFDLMGHHMVKNMLNVRNMLDALTVETDSIDGRKIYLYGEGWNFGELANGARGVNASQYNMAGTGIGTFNDRIRDAVRGGGAFNDFFEQGYITGLFTCPNEVDSQPEGVRLMKLFQAEDQIRVALAGNLADYQMLNAYGYWVFGNQVDYLGMGSGYTKAPEENIVYISAHDNETLFDAIQYKAPLWLSTAERARMQNLGISLLALSQGVPFFASGVELLRSKSMDRDSYNSGDWFNRLDYSYQSNNWGIGLPPHEKNNHNWPSIQPRLANPNLKPTRDDILATRNHFLEMLGVRKSSPLFRLRTAKEIFERVQFYNTGSRHIPGLIVMTIDDNAPLPDLDLNYDLIIVFFNAEAHLVQFTFHELEKADLTLHPIQANAADTIVRMMTNFDAATNTFSIPSRTTAVFVGKGKLPPPPSSQK